VTLTTDEFIEARIDASPVPATTRLLLARPPITADELWWTVYALWDVGLPRKKVCIDHQAPFDAFADAYFGNESNYALWYGSRGTGKSYMLAILALTVAALKEVNVTLLGGSMAQSQNVHEHVENLLKAPNAPVQMVENSIQSETSFGPGNWIRPLPASQKTVRGPHPTMTLLDEIDEMEKRVYDAAMGQALEQPNKRGVMVHEMVVASSTWQNPIGTFQEVMDDALEKGLPIFTWCWREVVKPHGWMSTEFIDRKRRTVPAEMFRVEYELGEPAGDARAFDLEMLKKYFVHMTPVSGKHKGSDHEWVYAEPEPGASYAAGADWAKEKDKTVFTVCRTDVMPRQIVYIRRLNRRSWPYMIGEFDNLVAHYNAQSAHDATGLGNVVHDFLDDSFTQSLKVKMIGQDRTKLLSDYIAAVENGEYSLPLNPPRSEGGAWGSPCYDAHKSTTVDEVWGTARWDSHLPDDVASAAIMHRAAERAPMPASPQGVAKTGAPPSAYRPLHPEPDQGEITSRREGDVRREDDWQDITDIPLRSEASLAETSGGAFSF
jgi:hypothetical protein